ncbi:hypothetical protein N7492_010004 [Penicillium capsulatum]|uniref:Zn(2)-C6 fungal-type domain-containing protein n=1 Tax=Penicillium capsulatum TaxID=69766 RepID=A0A9W9HQA9_9EURO|nr:hypothetical protein N7492_010004 [Penicillium capsulatum]KAJ6112513.1 hypothetical protein N7512_007837 [Penicillium capsulatum]
MKRTSPPGLTESPKKQPRQDPVSCESCRKKKLKCDRTQPCSSCSTRKICCSYTRSGPGPSLVKPVTQAKARTPLDNPAPTQEPHVTSRMPETPIRTRDDPLTTADWLETFMMGHRVPSAVPAPFRDELAQRQRLHCFRSPGNTLLGNLSSLVRAGQTVSLESPVSINLTLLLPSEAEAMELFDYYCNHLDWQYHLIIPHRTKEDIQNLYKLISHEPVRMNHLALLFSIVATALYFQLLSTETAQFAEMCSREAAYIAGSALIQSNFMAYPTIEGLQASMIIMHHLSSLTLSPSISALFSHSTCVCQAKSLGLHVIDRSVMAERRHHSSSTAGVELSRRLWWDLTTYDWLVSFLSGPQELTYIIHPNHMNVQKPLNIEDDDLETSQVDMPLSTPTCMSYTLHRLRLAEVCREMVDEIAPVHLHGQELSYEKVLDLDRKLHSAYAELPAFFRFDQSARRQYATLYRDRPAIAWQRAFMQQGYHSRLCRLHRQFFIQGAKDPKYSYSHVVSLQSARKVLEIKRIMDEEEPLFSPNSSFFWAVMHHVFMAAVILLIDVCFNWDDILAEKRKEEVLDACRMLSRAQQSSSVAREGINAMMGILRKYWKHERRPPSQNLQAEHPPPSGLDPSALEQEQRTPAAVKTAQFTPPLPDVSTSDPPMEQSTPTTSMAPLEDLWTELLDGSAHVELDTPDWMDMLTELTNSTVPCE